MESLVKEHAKLLEKQKATASLCASSLEEMLASLSAAKQAIQSAAPDPATKPSLTTSVKRLASQLIDCHKELQQSVSKYAKSVDKRFKTVDLDSVWEDEAVDGKQHIVNKIIAGQFVREGLFDLSEKFMYESRSCEKVSTDDMEMEDNAENPFEGLAELKNQLIEMRDILGEMKNGKLEQAISWARKHSKHLKEKGSSIEFLLHRLQFIQYLKNQDVLSALAYSKANFGPFQKTHMREIQRLSGSVIYAHRISTSPYADLVNPHEFTNVQQLFTREFCSMLGLSTEPPLQLAVTIGTSALPNIIKMATIMKSSSGLEWTSAGELPVEIPLLPANRYHSVFVCPVSKEPGTETNPPMMMLCGHVICHESLNRLSKNSITTRFKCPYCPTESTAAQAIRVHF
ncbi:hypothetical protein HK098_000154 [Nowakowskiella sp. JEL0407]|nr:hypothetical protein HK098_000154 [Nowakowskiella sp. JEL0407]